MNGDWLIRGRDGRLAVYLVSDDAVLCRAERFPGGPWEAPRRVGGDQQVHPVLGLGQGADDYAHLVSWWTTRKGVTGLVHSTHFRPLLAALDWAPLGHPDKKGGRTGTPAVAVDAEGRAHVFVRKAGGGVGMIAQKEKGGWEPWRDLEGQGVEEPPVAVTAGSGRVEAYAAAPGRILHWSRPSEDAEPELTGSLDAPVRAGTLRALATSAERTTVFYTDESGDLCAWRPGAEAARLLPAAGPGPVAAVRTELDGHDCTVFAQRSAGGRVAFAAYPTERESAGAWWTESGPQLPADAVVALAKDHQDRVVAAALSPSTGDLLLTRRKDEPGLALTAWQTV